MSRLLTPYAPTPKGRAAAARDPRSHAQEVAGPYRSQSSNPAIRAQATPHEHRLVPNPLDALDPHVAPTPPPLTPLGSLLATAPLAAIHPTPASAGVARLVNLLHLPKSLEDPETAYMEASLHGVQPPAALRKAYRRDYGPGLYAQIQKAALHKLSSEDNLGEPADLTNLALLVATAGGSAYLGGALKGAEAGAGVLEGADAAATGGRAATALRGAGKALTFPLRHPVITGASPLAAQAPVAAVHGDPAELGKALHGTGVEADLLAGAGRAITQAVPGVAGNALSDALSLPAQVLPSTYLTGKAAANAIGGNPAELDALRKGYRETSAFPALLEGHLGEAAQRAGEHPLYTALEALAVKAAVGHGAGWLLRKGGHPDFQHEQRPPTTAYGDVQRQRGLYSNDAFSRILQRHADARRPESPYGGLQMRPGETTRHLQQALDREVYTGDVVRRGEQQRTQAEVGAMRPAQDADAGVARLAMEGYARDPERAMADLTQYRDSLIAQQDRLPPSFREANQGVVEAINDALVSGDPQAMFDASTAYARHQAPVTKELVRLGILDEHQAAKATEIPYARTWMGSSHGLSKADEAMYEEIRQQMSQSGLSGGERGQLLGRLSRLRSRAQTLDAEGNPLSLDQIREHMRASGVGAPHSFVTQKLPAPAGPSSFYQPPTEHPSLAGPARTGEASTIGAFDPGWDAAQEQAVHSQTILDQAHGFRERLERFSLNGPEGATFSDYRQAQHATQHPEDFGMELPDVPGGWVPVAESPWLARKETTDSLAEVGSAGEALPATRSSESFAGGIADNMLQPGPGRYRLIPKTVADRLRLHYAEIAPVEKGAQAVTGALKGAWLPTSPKWITGNAVDNYVVRAFSTGVTPRDMVSGKRFAALFEEVLTPRERARALEPMISGGLFGSYPRLTPHREMRQFVGSRIEPLARAAHAVLSSPGIRTGAALYRRYRDTVFEFDSKFIEQLPQYGQLSKLARKELDMSRSEFRRAVAAKDEVVKDYIRGFRDPEKVDQMARGIESVFGNWGKVGPEARRFLNTLAPFWMWGRAAIKFAFLTMPRDHPILTGLIAASEQMTREERQKLGLDKGGDEPVPPFLQGGVPGPGGGVIGLSGLTTYGTAGNLPEFLANSTWPQIADQVKALSGVDWKGDQLVDSLGRPASELERIKAAVVGSVDQFLPFLNVARSITDRGASGALPAREYPAPTVDYLRGLHNTQQINVPVSGSGGASSGNPLDALDQQLDGGGNPLDQLDKALEAGG